MAFQFTTYALDLNVNPVPVAGDVMEVLLRVPERGQNPGPPGGPVPSVAQLCLGIECWVRTHVALGGVVWRMFRFTAGVPNHTTRAVRCFSHLLFDVRHNWASLRTMADQVTVVLFLILIINQSSNIISSPFSLSIPLSVTKMPLVLGPGAISVMAGPPPPVNWPPPLPPPVVPPVPAPPADPQFFIDLLYYMTPPFILARTIRANPNPGLSLAQRYNNGQAAGIGRGQYVTLICNGIHGAVNNSALPASWEHGLEAVCIGHNPIHFASPNSLWVVFHRAPAQGGLGGIYRSYEYR
jgi:hypothetical protein